MKNIKYLHFQIRDSTARDEWVKERSKSINQVREAERNADNTARNVAQEKLQWVCFIFQNYLFLFVPFCTSLRKTPVKRY